MDQSGNFANPARGQLMKLFYFYFFLSPFAPENLVSRDVKPSRPASGCSFSILGLNLVLTHGIPPDFLGSVHYLFIPPYYAITLPFAFTAEIPPAQGQ